MFCNKLVYSSHYTTTFIPNLLHTSDNSCKHTSTYGQYFINEFNGRVVIESFPESITSDNDKSTTFRFIIQHVFEYIKLNINCIQYYNKSLLEDRSLSRQIELENAV